jgi:hypothetical protein
VENFEPRPLVGQSNAATVGDAAGDVLRFISQNGDGFVDGAQLAKKSGASPQDQKKGQIVGPCQLLGVLAAEEIRTKRHYAGFSSEMASVLVQAPQNASDPDRHAVKQADEHPHFLASLAEFPILAESEGVIQSDAQDYVRNLQLAESRIE